MIFNILAYVAVRLSSGQRWLLTILMSLTIGGIWYGAVGRSLLHRYRQGVGQTAPRAASQDPIRVQSPAGTEFLKDLAQFAHKNRLTTQGMTTTDHTYQIVYEGPYDKGYDFLRDLEQRDVPVYALAMEPGRLTITLSYERE